MNERLIRIMGWLDYLSGARDSRPSGSLPVVSSRFWSVWWFLMLVMIMFFSGQHSEFIYIDF